MYQEINNVKFNITPNTYNTEELTEGVISSVAQSYSVFDENGLRKVVTDEFGLIKLISVLWKLKKLFQAPGNGMQKILRLIYAIGPVSLVILYALTITNRGKFVLDIIINVMRGFSGVTGKGNLISIILNILGKFVTKVNGSIFSVIIMIILIPISAFFTAIGSMLVLGDQQVQNILPPIRMREYLGHLKNIFKNLGKGVLDIIPFAKPILGFFSTVFNKIIAFFKTGSSQAKRVVSSMEKESKTQTESDNKGNIVSFLLVPLGIFLLSILKKLKVLGIFGLLFIAIMKFVPGLKSILAKIPVINKIYPLMLSAGASLASRLKLNNFSTSLKQKAEEFKQLKETVTVMNTINH